MPRLVRRALVLAVLMLTTGLAMSAHAATNGALFQDLGTAGCIHNLGGGGCTTGFGLEEATLIAVSPDGRNLYVASSGENDGSGAIAVLSRDPTTGVVTPLAGTAGCVAETTALGASHCTPAIGLLGARAIAVTPDGKFVYSAGDNCPLVCTNDYAAIAIFSRDTGTGALTQLPGPSGCLSGTGSNNDPRCASFGGELGDPSDIVISPDSRFLYLADADVPSDGDIGNINVFSRDTTSGALTQLALPDGCVKQVPAATGCAPGRATREIKDMTLSPDGAQLYVAASEGVTTTDEDGAVAIFDRNDTTGVLTQKAGTAGCINVTGDDGSGAGTCATGKALHDAYAIAVSPDGKNAYLATQGESYANNVIGSLDIFARDGAGNLTQLDGTDGCVTQDGGNGYETPPVTPICALGRAQFEPSGVAVSPDNASVYITASDRPSAVSVFARDQATGKVSQLDGAAGCVSTGGLDSALGSTCTLGNELEGATGIVALPAVGRAGCVHVYVATQEDSSLITLQRQVECAPPPVVTPTATTNPASAINANGATLNGTLDPGTADTTYVFEFGTTASYGQQTKSTAVSATPAGPRPVSAALDGLQTGRTYHYRLVATNSAGVATGADVTFVPKPPKKKPKSLKTSVKFKNGVLTVSGKLSLPAGVTKKAGCKGKVTVQAKAGKKRLAKRTAKVKSSCKFSAKINLAKKLKGHPKLTVSSRFGGNAVLKAISAKTRTVKT